MLHRRSGVSQLRLVLVSALAVLLGACVESRAQDPGPGLKIPGADMGLTDAKEMREKGLAAEAKQDWDSALTYWERVIDRSVSSRAQREEAYAHIHAFRDKVKPFNADPAKAMPWPTLVVIFKNVDVKWEGGSFKSTVTDKDMEDARFRVDAFAKSVFEFTDGLLRIDPEFLVIEEPLTTLDRSEPGPSFSCNREAEMKLIRGHLQGQGKGGGTPKRYEHVLAYVKFVGDDGKVISPPYLADTGGGGPDGASFMDCPWFPGYYKNIEPGEIEMHEFLHPVHMIFNDIVCYPDGIAISPDWGGGQNTTWKQIPGEPGIMSLYKYIMSVRYTRLMWSELTQEEPKESFWGGPNLCDWVVLGPFTAPEGADALDQAFIDEEKIQPAEGAEAGGKTWVHARSLNGVLDLTTVLGDKPNAVAYVATLQRICGKYNLSMGSSGGLKAFLNGKLVHTAKGPRDFAFNQDKVEIMFKPGYELNLYVFKVQNSGKGWKLQARTSGLDGGTPWGSEHELPGAK